MGIRCSPTEATYAICKSSSNSIELVQLDVICTPKYLDESERLRYVRNVMMDILNQHSVEKSVVRIIENNARRTIAERVRMEGVIIEAIASSGVRVYSTFVISQIGSRLGIPSNEVLSYISGATQYDSIEEWATYTNLEREAILAALSSNYT